MTKTQIKKLLADVDAKFEITGKGANWEIECANKRASTLVRRALRVAKVPYNGFLGGWGGWVFRAGAAPTGYQYECDFNDKASVHHY